MADDIELQEEDALAAEYVLGLLTDEEAAAFEDLMAVDPDMRERYAFWADNMAALTDDIPEETPPAAILTRLAENLFAAETGSQEETTVDKGRSLLQRLGLLPAIGGGLLAALAALFIVDATLATDPPQWSAAEYVADIAAEDSSLILQARFLANENLLVIDRTEGGARPDRVLELWLIAGGADPVSLGVLPEEDQVALQLDDTLAAALEGGILAISDEPSGGSPTGAPTGEVLATGALVAG